MIDFYGLCGNAAEKCASLLSGREFKSQLGRQFFTFFDRESEEVSALTIGEIHFRRMSIRSGPV